MASLDRLAEIFDLPPESSEHQDLESTAWMGGPLTSVRYWLGRHLRRNFFRESDESVTAALVQYFSDQGCRKGAELATEQGSWSSLAILLRHQWELEKSLPLSKSPKLGVALNAVLVDPDLTIQELAEIANTTERQVVRMTDVNWLKELWRRRNV